MEPEEIAVPELDETGEAGVIDPEDTYTEGDG